MPTRKSQCSGEAVQEQDWGRLKWAKTGRVESEWQ